MQAPGKAHDESLRLHTLRSLNLLDTPAEERFDRLTRLARSLFDMPIAVISLIDTNRQWFKSCDGLEARETSRDVSFCGHAILQNGVFEIPDATLDARFSDNPLVTGKPYIRYYAGRPLKARNGTAMGTLCLIDHRPRSLNPEQQARLNDMADLAEQEIEALQSATIDPLTRVANLQGFEHMANYALSLCRRVGTQATLLLFDLENFQRINERFGYIEGDQALKGFAQLVRSVLREMDTVGRLGGDRFVVLLMGASLVESRVPLARIDQALEAANRAAARAYALHYRVVACEYEMARHPTLSALLAQTIADMQRRKECQG